jgi:hypothetical protein
MKSWPLLPTTLLGVVLLVSVRASVPASPPAGNPPPNLPVAELAGNPMGSGLGVWG